MYGYGQPRHGRAAWAFVIVGLLLSASSIVYILAPEQPRTLPPLETASRPVASIDASVGRELNTLVAFLVFSLLLVLAFLVGSYVMVQIGRAFVRKPASSNTTAYVDAWSEYRLTQQEIEAATREPQEPETPDHGPHDYYEDERPDEAPP